MIEHSESIAKLAIALHAAQSKMRGVKKDSKNPHFKANYASLEAVIDTVRGPLIENGVVFTQAPGALVDGAIEVTTMLIHTSGEWLRSTLHVPLGKRDPQGVGSAVTYGCRYSLMAALGVPPVDDDGEHAMDRNGLPPPAPEVTSGPIGDALNARAMAAATNGMKEYEAFFKALPPAAKRALTESGVHDKCKEAAAYADRKEAA